MKLIGTIVMMIGIILVYDARQLTKKFFKVNNLNVATFTCKVIGFTLFVIGGLIILFT